MVQGLEVVDETRREAHDVGNDGDEEVGDRGKSGAKVKEEQGGVKGRVSGLGKEASLSLARNEVVFASLGVNGDNVVDSLAPYGKAVLLLVCPIFDGVGEFTIDRRSNSFVVGVFKAQRSGLVGFRLTLSSASSSLEPLARKIPRLMLNPGGAVPVDIMWRRARWRASAPVVPVASHAA